MQQKLKWNGEKMITIGEKMNEIYFFQFDRLEQFIEN